MQYKEYGTTGKRVSRLGFGAMRPCRDDELFVEIMRHAFDRGVNYVDTAAMYDGGTNEVLVGKAIRGRRDRLFVSTKNHYKGRSGDEWQRVLERSLRQLNVDHIDFYHLHSIGWETFRSFQGRGRPLERFLRAKEQGLVGHLCFSSHDSPSNICKLVDTGLFAGMLVQYNLLNRDNEGAIARARQAGMGVAIMGPVGGGRLVTPPLLLANVQVQSGSSPELALRFVLANPGVTLALSGMNSMAMVEENIATASREEPLANEELCSIRSAMSEMRGLDYLTCTGCAYCMPCPNGVDIPANSQAMVYSAVWGLHDEARAIYRELGGEGGWAEACIDCGECVPKCPQGIPIPQRLRETAEALGDLCR